MRYIKKIENISLPKNEYFYFKDKNLIVHKIVNGTNQDKIFFKFYNDINSNYSDKYSMMLGCTKILDTEYENNERIRNMELGGTKFRKLQQNTYHTIINYFLENFGYEKKDMNFIKGRLPYIKWESYFKIELQKIETNANNIGDILDKLKKFRNGIFYELMEIEKFRFKNDVKKYNI